MPLEGFKKTVKGNTFVYATGSKVEYSSDLEIAFQRSTNRPGTIGVSRPSEEETGDARGGGGKLYDPAH